MAFIFERLLNITGKNKYCTQGKQGSDFGFDVLNRQYQTRSEFLANPKYPCKVKGLLPCIDNFPCRSNFHKHVEFLFVIG